MDDLLSPTIILVTCLGCGVIAGVFFAFSTFIMAALSRRPAPEAIAAMQAINVVVLNGWFLGVFLGTGALCIAAVTASAWDGISTRTVPAGLGAALYLVGTLGVTLACNVPRNDALARVDPADPGGAEIWGAYSREWTAWNHVRTGAALAAAGAFAYALAR